MTLNSFRLFQLFKYSVYALLTLNIYLFFADEWAATAHVYRDGVQLGEIIEGFAATIDTAAWVVLLLMFELETWVLDDRQFTRRVTITLHTVRAVSYAFILYAFYGYLSKLLFLQQAAPVESLTNLCTLVADGWAYAIDLDEYVTLTAANCVGIAAGSPFLQLPGIEVVVDSASHTDIVRLAWVDVINAGTWLLVVALLEIDVRLQENGLLEGRVLTVSTILKYVLYSILFLAAVYWGVKGDFVDFWDAFLWLVAFVFIELNVFEWRQESHAEHTA